MAESSGSEAASAPGPDDKPVVVVCVGMAGSGKTTFMQRINAHLHAKKQPPYVINLDPAVINVPFDSNIDIRDSVNYKEVMRQYNLGPNGGILTSLNLFATKVDQILGLLEKRTARDDGPENGGKKPPIEHILVDTPGQIEAFVWSASGTILLESLASSFPTVVAYVVDTPRTRSTSTFMSNMLYACSILYKTKLPMILVFNKTDVADASFAKEWMTDFEAFQEGLRADEAANAFGSSEGDVGMGGSGFMSSLLNSMSMVLEEFYAHLSVVAVSSMTGHGVDDFFDAVRVKAAEFVRDYQPELERRRGEREAAKKLMREQELNKMMDGLAFAGDKGAGKKTGGGEGSAVAEGEDGGEDPAVAALGRRVDAAAAADSEESADDDEMDDEGLQARYEAALRDEGSRNQDMSFANYLHSQSNQ